MTKEHAWPTWARELLGNAPRTIQVEHFNIPVLEFTGPGAGAVFKKACGKCNNARFNRHEIAAQPILTPLIMGESGSLLDEAAQQIVAEWAIKTTMVFDVGGGKGLEYHFPQSVRQEFIVDGKVPANTQVLVASCAAWDAYAHGYRELKQKTVEAVWFLSTIIIGQFLVQVTHEMVPAGATPRPLLSDPMRGRQILPFEDEYVWPPNDPPLDGKAVWAIATPTPRVGV